MKYILDTNSIIYWIKGIGNFENKINQLEDNNKITATIITICEIYYGVEKSKKKETNLKFLNEIIEKIGQV
jgi:predicted nucleic acid-binding protein